MGLTIRAGGAARTRVLGLGLGLTALPGCGRSPAPAGDSVVAASRPASGSAVEHPACPKTGHWTPCQVKSRLDAAGVAPRADSAAPELPALGVAPTVYLVGKAPLAVYRYPDSTARARGARMLDTAKFIAPSAALTMRGEATAIQNDNLLALLFSRNDLQRERVSDAFLAGAPQP
jgi:hypothetical protein